MAMHKKNVDWAALEAAYRTGRSFRMLARHFGISSTRIKQVADENNWTRDLSEIIAEKTKAKLNAANLNGKVNGMGGTERQVVEATVQVQTNIVLAHRADIQRARGLVVALLQELELEIEHRHARPGTNEAPGMNQIGAQLSGRNPGGKPVPLAVQANTIKALGEALKTLTGLERQAFNITDVVAGPTPEQPNRDRSPLDGLDILDAAWARVLGDVGASV